MSESFEESYNAKLENIDDFNTKVSSYLKVSVSENKVSSYVHLLSAIFEPIVLNGFKVTGVTKSGSVCIWLDSYTSSFMYVDESKELYRKVRTLRNSIVHINIGCENDLETLFDLVNSMPYPIFKQCMEDLLQDFKSLYDLKSIYLKLGGNKDTITDDDELPQIE